MPDPKSGDTKPSPQTETAQEPDPQPRPEPTSGRLTELEDGPSGEAELVERIRDASEESK